MIPSPQATTSTSITVQWNVWASVRDEVAEYYEYKVHAKPSDSQDASITLVQQVHHSINQSSQETTVTGLLPNVRYEIWVIPYRKIVGTDFHRDIVEAGTPSHKLIVRTLQGDYKTKSLFLSKP